MEGTWAMKKIFYKKLGLLITCTQALTLQACSLSSYGSSEGILGGLAGAGAGAGVGYLIGEEYGKKTENLALGTGVGAASGLVLGALLHERSAPLDQEKTMVVRQAKFIGERQKEIDNLREEVDSESSWGRLDVKPWSERYQVETSELPYQGLSLE